LSSDAANVPFHTDWNGLLQSQQLISRTLHHSNVIASTYEGIIDQELALARCFMFTHQVAAVFCVKWPHGRHFEIMTSNQKSDSVSHWTLNTQWTFFSGIISFLDHGLSLLILLLWTCGCSCSGDGLRKAIMARPNWIPFIADDGAAPSPARQHFVVIVVET